MPQPIMFFKDWINSLLDSWQKPDYNALQRDIDWYRRIEHIDEPIYIRKPSKHEAWWKVKNR